MGKFEDHYSEFGDATVSVVVYGCIKANARIWIQPAEPANGIPEAYIDDYVLFDPETDLPFSNNLQTIIDKIEGEDERIKAQIWNELKEMKNE